jgi:hypothetical protein
MPLFVFVRSSIGSTVLVAAALIAGAGTAAAESADCRAQLARQDEQCQVLGEKLEAACPGGQNIKTNADCRQISTQIANSCTRKPCAPARKAKGKGRAKGKAMGKGMGKSMGRKAPSMGASDKSK